MNKKIKYLLIFSTILTIILLINIVNYYIFYKNEKSIIDDNFDYQEKIKKEEKKIQELIKELDNQKEEKKDKIWEYERWTKWNKELKEKIN